MLSDENIEDYFDPYQRDNTDLDRTKTLKTMTLRSRSDIISLNEQNKDKPAQFPQIIEEEIDEE